MGEDRTWMILLLINVDFGDDGETVLMATEIIAVVTKSENDHY